MKTPDTSPALLLALGVAIIALALFVIMLFADPLGVLGISK